MRTYGADSGTTLDVADLVADDAAGDAAADPLPRPPPGRLTQDRATGLGGRC